MAKKGRRRRPWAPDYWGSTNKVDEVEFKSLEGGRRCGGSSGRSPDEWPLIMVAEGGLGAQMIEPRPIELIRLRKVVSRRPTLRRFKARSPDQPPPRMIGEGGHGRKNERPSQNRDAES